LSQLFLYQDKNYGEKNHGEKNYGEPHHNNSIINMAERNKGEICIFSGKRLSLQAKQGDVMMVVLPNLIDYLIDI